MFVEALTFVFSEIICLNVGDGSRLERVELCQLKQRSMASGCEGSA